MRSAGPTPSEPSTFSRRHMESLADELGEGFNGVDLSQADTLELIESPKGSHEGITKDTRSAESVAPEEHQHPTAEPSPSTSSAIVELDPDSPATLVVDDEWPTPVDTASNAAPDRPPRKSNFVEHLSPVDSPLQPKSCKEHIKTMAWTHNRDLINRNADGFFDMETRPTSTDVERHVQQSHGIAALQRTLVPSTLSDVASSSTGSSQASSSTAADSVKRSSTLRQVTFAELRGRRSNKVLGPYPYTGPRIKTTSRFSLGRDLIAAGHVKKLSEPSAPARFVKMPTDPDVDFKRNFRQFGLKIETSESELDRIEGRDSGSIASPEFDSAAGFTFKKCEPGIDKVAAPRLEFGVPRAFIADQCLESSCPLRWAHAKGPYHHKGDRHNKIMTGLFGHSNPPPEIWNAYRNMVHITCDGEVISPNGRPGSQADEDLVIAFATLHFGELNGISGDEFHRRYAGKHMSSRVSVRSSSTNSSQNESLK